LVILRRTVNHRPFCSKEIFPNGQW
jgi:hypothetical protein